MELELFYPNLPSCDECQKYQLNYDFQTHRAANSNLPTGARLQRRGRDGKLCDRERDGPPPCKERPGEAVPICPKISPEREHEHVLSDKNWQTYQLARRVRATAGRCLSDAAAADELLAANLAIANQLIDAHDRQDLAERTAIKLALLMPK